MQSLWNLVIFFLKFSWQSVNFVRILIKNIIFLFLIFIIISAYLNYKKQQHSNYEYYKTSIFDLNKNINNQNLNYL